jgi:hydroxylamine reductase (hybrid-cluster protein)
MSLHRLWKIVREPFLLPQTICTHSDKWEQYDMHMAGCTECGKVHICKHGQCNTHFNQEGHSICQITGLCVKMLNFSNDEYIETAQPPLPVAASHRRSGDALMRKDRYTRMTRKKRFANMAASVVLSTHSHVVCDERFKTLDDSINSTVYHVMCSNEWSVSRDAETCRYVSKGGVAFTKVLKDFKRANPGILPIIPDMFITTMAQMNHARVPSNVAIGDRKRLCDWCIVNIRHHLMLLSVKYPDILQWSKIRG